MAMLPVTDPFILDSTGQQILSALQDIAEATQPTNVYIDLEVTLPASGWSNETPSSYTWTSEQVTTECAVEVYFANGSENVLTPYIQYEKGSQSVVFTSPAKPNANIPVIIRIINAKADSINNITDEMVSTSTTSGASNVKQALTMINSNISTLNSKLTKKNLGTIASLSSLESSISSFLGELQEGELRTIRFNNDTAFGLFTWTGTWVGIIQRSIAGRGYIRFYTFAALPSKDIVGYVKDGVYYWDSYALNSKLDIIGVYDSGTSSGINVNNDTNTALKTINLPANGTYLISARIDFATTSGTGYRSLSRTFAGSTNALQATSGISGVWESLSASDIVTTGNTSTPYTINATQSSGATIQVGYTYAVIRIK